MQPSPGVILDCLSNQSAWENVPGCQGERLQELRSRILEKVRAMPAPETERMNTLWHSLPPVMPSIKNISLPLIQIGLKEDLADFPPESWRQILKSLKPWRKGPFELFGERIDAEWQSNRKWDRLEPHLGSLRGLSLLDMGCNNGYTCLRLASHHPRLVVGCDPVWLFAFQFLLIQHFARFPELLFLPLGIEDLDLFPGCFDRILCLGVLYHHRDPYAHLAGLRSALARGGVLFLESLSVPGADPVAWLPRKTYAGAKGIWWVPTCTYLVNMLRRAGFREVRLLNESPLTGLEQRQTPWADGPSLCDFLDPVTGKTLEGYPPPSRVLFAASV